MKTQTKTLDDVKIGDKVKHHSATEKSPNHVGTIIEKEGDGGQTTIIISVKFRDFTEYYSLDYVLKNLLP